MTIEKPKPDMVFNVWSDGSIAYSVKGEGIPASLHRSINRDLTIESRIPYRIRVYLKTKKAA